MARRLNARAHGIQGSLPLGSSVSSVGPHLTAGSSFFASGPVWIEAVTSYEGTSFSPRISIGDNVRASPRLHVSAVESITIGDWVLFGENVFVSDHQHGATSGDASISPQIAPALRPLGAVRPVSIGARCHLGNNVVVLPGTVLGDGCIVGANSVVSGTFEGGTIVVGAPARIVKRWNEDTLTWESSRQ